MNKSTMQLVKDYVVRTLDEPNGVSIEAYKALMALMREERDFAMEMHDVVSRVALSKERYFLLEEPEEEVEGYEL